MIRTTDVRKPSPTEEPKFGFLQHGELNHLFEEPGCISAVKSEIDGPSLSSNKASKQVTIEEELPMNSSLLSNPLTEPQPVHLCDKREATPVQNKPSEKPSGNAPGQEIIPKPTCERTLLELVPKWKKGRNEACQLERVLAEQKFHLTRKAHEKDIQSRIDGVYALYRSYLVDIGLLKEEKLKTLKDYVKKYGPIMGPKEWDCDHGDDMWRDEYDDSEEFVTDSDDDE